MKTSVPVVVVVVVAVVVAAAVGSGAALAAPAPTASGARGAPVAPVAAQAPAASAGLSAGLSAGIGAVESVERFRVPAARSVIVDAMARRIVVRGDPASLAAALAHSALCHDVKRVRGGVELSCATRLIDASLKRGEREVRRLRVVPPGAGESAAPVIAHLAPELGLSGPCPGATEAVRGECAYIAGDRAAAKVHFTASLTVPGIESQHALIRLGDLALESGDFDGAVDVWDRGGGGGPFSRLAAARLCEIDPTCITDPIRAVGYDPFDPRALAQPLADEVVLRHARALAFHDDVGGAVKALLAQKAAPCVRAPGLCRAVAFEAMREAGDAPDPEALALYSMLPARLSGPTAFDLARSAAEQAALQGAPLYAAHLLSAASPIAPTPALESHLARTAELYLLAGDPARAGAVVAYAQSRFPSSRRFVKIAEDVARSMHR